MTRNQAAKIADRIVKLANMAVPAEERRTWTSVTIEVTQNDRDALDENGGLIVGCLPLGWRLTGPKGTTAVTVLRNA